MTKARDGRWRAGTTVSYMQDAVNVIRHDDELVEHEVRKMDWELFPALRDPSSGGRQPNAASHNVTE